MLRYLKYYFFTDTDVAVVTLAGETIAALLSGATTGPLPVAATDSAFAHPLTRMAEAAETQTWVELARRCGYLSTTDATSMNDLYNGLIAQLVTMIKVPEKWGFAPRMKTEGGKA